MIRASRIGFVFPGYMLLLGLLAISTPLSSQQNQLIDTFSRDQIPILIEPMQYPEGLPAPLVERIQAVAYTSLENHWHYQVINHSSKANTGEIDPEYIFQLSLEPLIDELSQNDSRDSNRVVFRTNYFFQAGISLNLRVTNIVTGEIQYSEEVESRQYGQGRKNFKARTFFFDYGRRPDWYFPKKLPYPSSPEEEAQIILNHKADMLNKALDEFPAIWQRTLVEIFPSPIHLVSVLDGSKKKPKVIVVDAGLDFGLKKNAPMELYVLKVYNAMGEQFVREERLGYFYPKEIEANSSVGNILGGRKAVGQALERGETIFCRFMK